MFYIHEAADASAASLFSIPIENNTGFWEVRPIAATRLIPLHINKGKTIAQTLNDRTNYAKNPEKTEKGEFIAIIKKRVTLDSGCITESGDE